MASPVTAEGLFTQYFLPLYPEDARADLEGARRADANPAGNPALFAHLDDAAEVFARMGPRLFEGEAFDLDFTDESVHRLSARLTPARRNGWASRGAAGSAESELFNVVVHGAAYVGACIVRRHGGTWRVRRPLWETLVGLSSPAGDAELAVFHWWLKSLADGGAAGAEGLPAPTLADRYRTHVEIPCTDAAALPIVFQGERRLPRLSKVRYDVFYKYLKAHLPEIRDVGADFPSPARFDELAFRWLEAHVVGGGRAVVLVGHGATGVHLVWMGANGFDKAAFFPCDAFPDPVLRNEGGRLCLVLSAEGRAVTHEMLWWGP